MHCLPSLSTPTPSRLTSRAQLHSWRWTALSRKPEIKAEIKEKRLSVFVWFRTRAFSARCLWARKGWSTLEDTSINWCNTGVEIWQGEVFLNFTLSRAGVQGHLIRDGKQHLCELNSWICDSGGQSGLGNIKVVHTDSTNNKLIGKEVLAKRQEKWSNQYVKGKLFVVMDVTSGRWWPPVKESILIDLDGHLGMFKRGLGPENVLSTWIACNASEKPVKS